MADGYIAVISGPSVETWLFATSTFLGLVGLIWSRSRKLWKRLQDSGRANELEAAITELRLENADLRDRVRTQADNIVTLTRQVAALTTSNAALLDATTHAADVAGLTMLVKDNQIQVMTELGVIKGRNP